MTTRFCDVCGEQIHGKRDRIFAVLPDKRQIIIVVHVLGDDPDPDSKEADVCMDCIRDVVKNRKFTRAKESIPSIHDIGLDNA